MIAYLKGALLAARNNSCIILTNAGIGYEIALPSHTFGQLPAIGNEVALYTYMAVREDAQELFGFETLEERVTFEILISISKIGARSAMAILSLYRPEDLDRIVMGDDVLALTKVSGIGQKTAQHVLLELRYKLPKKSAMAQPAPQPAGIYGDVLAALANLGYDESECGPQVRQILAEEPDLDVGGAIRQTLKTLTKRQK